MTAACSKELPAKEFCDFAQETANACIDEWKAMSMQTGWSAVGCPRSLGRFQPVYEASWAAARTEEERKAIEMVHERFLRLSEVSSKPNTIYTAWMKCERVREFRKGRYWHQADLRPGGILCRSHAGLKCRTAFSLIGAIQPDRHPNERLIQFGGLRSLKGNHEKWLKNAPNAASPPSLPPT
jgi:hypothetical protein